MANTKVTKGILADDSVGIDQLHIENSFSSGMSLSYSPTSGNLAWANTGVAGISSSADATAITIDSSENVAITGNLSAVKLTATEGVLELDDNGSHNGIINSPASLRINIDSDDGASGEAFAVGHNQTAINTSNELFKVHDSGYAEFAGASDLRVTFGSAGTAGSNSANWVRGQSNYLAFNSAGSGFKYEISGSEKMRLDSAGKLGIGTGTSDPDTQLHVKNTSGIELRLEADSNNSGQEDCFIRFYTDGKTQEGIAGMDNNNSSTLFSGNTENAMVFGTVSNLPTLFATNNTERMIINNDGLVGIAHSSPTASLHVKANATDHLLHLQRPDDIANRGEPYVELMIQNQEGSGGHNYGGLAVMADNQAHIRFQVSNSDDWGGSGAKRWQIRCGQAAGEDRLGVYSWTAASDLHLWDSGGNQHIRGDNANVQMFFGSQGGLFGGNASHNIRAASNLFMFNAGGSNGQFVFEANGHGMLSLYGESSTAVVINGHNSTGGSVNWIPHSSKGSNESHAHYGSNGDWYIRPANNSGYVYVKNYQAESDERLKENIEDITYGTDEILQLQPRKFNWIDNSEEQNGFIAQEVESVLPNFVATGDMKIDGHEEEEGIKSVNYNSIVATLVKSVQELEARIAELENG